MKSQPLHLLLVDHAPIIGGVEMMIRDLLTALDPARVTATVVTDVNSPMRGRFSATVPEIALPLMRLKRNPLAWLTLLSSAAALARAARNTKAEVIQTFTARTHLIGALAGVLARVPVVWRLNDDTLPRPIVRAVGQIPRRIITVSDYLRRHYASTLKVTDLIPDGVPLPSPIPIREARRQMNLPEDALIVALVARLVRWKGHAVFLRALAQLAPEYPQLRGLIVGGWSEADNRPGPLAGGEPYQQELFTLAQELGLKERVTFTGYTDATAYTFSAADIVAHTSILPEPFGRVIVEAMAAARPVVAARAGGAPEIVEDKITGLLTPPGDADALANALRQLLGDSGLCNRMGEAGRARAEREYSVSRMAAHFTEVWEEAANDNLH
jgi:glycosyltransferase involved in cell wall biosynthesis